MRTTATLERSVRARRSCSRSIMAIIGGTAGGAETHHGQTRWTLRPPCGVAKYQPRAGVASDEIDGIAGKAVIDRHCDESGAHDAVIGGDELGPVGGQNRDAVAACQSARRE